jgi:hypothetical protein
MLSDRDRERLREIQRRFMTEDPDFVREFGARPQQPAARSQPRAVGPNPDAYTICVVGAISLSVLMLLAGWLVTALVFAIGAGLLSSAQHRKDNDSNRPGT